MKRKLILFSALVHRSTVRRLLPTSFMLLLFRRLKILLRRFVRLGSFADHIKRALKLVSISTLSHFDSGRLDNPFGQRNCPGRSDCGEYWYFQSANPPANPPMNSPMNPSTN